LQFEFARAGLLTTDQKVSGSNPLGRPLFGSRKMADGKINRENARDLFAKHSHIPRQPVKVLLPLSCVAITFATILFSSGCQKETVTRDLDSQSNGDLREKTKPLQAADLVGYDGTKLRKSVDKITQDNNKRNKELENLADDR